MNLFHMIKATKTIAESNEIKEKSRLKSSYFTRERKMSFSELVYYVLHPGKESCQLGLQRFFKLLGKQEVSMSEQAFSKARGHFTHEPFETMVRQTTQMQYDGSSSLNQWNKQYIFAVDGTTLALPDKPSLCKNLEVQDIT